MKVAVGNQACCWLLLLCAGCAHTLTVTATGTKAIEAPIPSHVTYVVLPTNEVENDRAFPEYAKLVTNKMDARDYKQTSEKTAQLGVFLAYATNEGMNEGMTENAAKPRGPVMGMGGNIGGGMGAGSPGGGGYDMPVESTSNPAGLKTYSNQVAIVVVDLPKSRAAGKTVELWRGETFSTGSSNDLAQVVPILVEAAFRHFDETTSKHVQHTFNEEEVKSIRAPK